MQEHAKYAASMKDAGVVIRRYIGADRIGLGSEVDGDLQTHLPLDAFDPPGQFSPRQPASGAAVQGLGEPGATSAGDECRFENIAVRKVTALGNKRLAGGYGEETACLWGQQFIEQGWGVHVGHAPPVDRSVQADERNGAAIS